MKKLMIVGAMAAASVAFGAEASYWAQVYDATLTLKTGVCKASKASAATVKFYRTYYGSNSWSYAPFEKGDEAGFRKQATRKISGLFWGCECETIAQPGWRRYGAARRSLGGYVFWDQAVDKYFIIPYTVFNWGCLNRITDSFKKIEGAWVLANAFERQAMLLMGAGFGTASAAAKPCRSIINKISGSFAGFRYPGLDDAVGSCPYCGVDGCTVEPFCYACNYWSKNPALTAAYGSWSIKFNKTAANKLKTSTRISQSYKFKKAGNLATVLARMEDWVAKTANSGTGNDSELEATFADYDDEGKLIDPEGYFAEAGSVNMTKQEVGSAYSYGVNEDIKLSDVEDKDSIGDEEYLDTLIAEFGLQTEDGYIVVEDDDDEASLFNPAALINSTVQSYWAAIEEDES